MATLPYTDAFLAERADPAEVAFEELVERFRADPAVMPPAGGAGFGAAGLKVDGKLFAMLSKGALIVKLPRERVDELVGTGTGTRFDPGHGRVMKEWIEVPVARNRRWRRLAEEAQEFAP